MLIYCIVVISLSMGTATIVVIVVDSSSSQSTCSMECAWCYRSCMIAVNVTSITKTTRIAIFNYSMLF